LPLHSTNRVTSSARAVDHALEAAIGQIGQRRPSARMPQQAFRRHDHQRARVGIQHQRLAAQQVEVLCRAGDVCDANIVFGGKLEEALQARAGMFWPLALVAMWQ
jgi:hypothetical protein